MNVLFTGFPGFIGARLLPRLLELVPESAFRCLVQEKFLPVARADVEVLEARFPHTRGRIRLLVGDITLPHLGLAAGEAESLQADLAGAYHLAAVYDLAVSRAVGQRINVDGTKNVVDFLAGAKRFDRLHYVSTAYVAGAANGVFRETDLDVGQSFNNHYEETKFLAEVEVVKSGVPATIYRPGVVVGDSRTGETAKFDGPYFALRAMERIPSPGVFMKVGSGRRPVNLVPVDFVIEALARLAALPSSSGKTYHLTDPKPLSAFEIERLFAKALGKSFVYVPVPPGIARALFAPKLVQDYFGMPVESVDYFDYPCSFDATQATKDLTPLGIGCPRFEEYVPRLVEFYRAKRGSVRRTAMI